MPDTPSEPAAHPTPELSVPPLADSQNRGSTGTPPRASSTAASPLTVLTVVVFGVAFYGAIAFFVGSIFSSRLAELRGQLFAAIIAHPLYSVAGILVLSVAGVFAWWLSSQRWEDWQSAIAFGVIPFILVGAGGLAFLVRDRRLFTVQLAFLFVSSVLPGALYYLFLRTRRPSILNQFTANLARLGILLPRRARESTEERRARVNSCFQRFEAVYGVLRFEERKDETQNYTREDYVDALLAATDRASRGTSPDEGAMRLPRATVRLTDILTANILIPIGIATFLSALGWLLVLDPYWLPGIDGHPASASGLIPAPTALNFAFLGAYFFGLQALFRRFVRRDLGPNAYLAFSNRIVLSAIGVWVIIAVFALADSASLSTRSPVAAGPSTSVVGSTIVSSDPATGSRAGATSERTGLLVAAFIVGVFPRTLWQVITAALKKISWVKLVVPSVEAKQPLEELDGLTVWHEARLEEEDIENVPNMATADVVDLMLQTQIPAERLVDWVDQAILYKVLGPDSDTESKPTRRSRLRTGGIRTATQLVRVYAMSEGPERSALSGLLRSESTSPLPVIVETIQIEANWQLVAAWRGVDFQSSTT